MSTEATPRVVRVKLQYGYSAGILPGRLYPGRQLGGLQVDLIEHPLFRHDGEEEFQWDLVRDASPREIEHYEPALLYVYEEGSDAPVAKWILRGPSSKRVTPRMRKEMDLLLLEHFPSAFENVEPDAIFSQGR
jgi:hypothetical protein